MAQTLDLMIVFKSNFTTSFEADQACNELLGRLGMSARLGPARLAIARSLSVEIAPPATPVTGRGEGRAIHGQQLFGDDLKLWVALIVEHAGHELTTFADFRELVRRHWHRGSMLLRKDWEDAKDSHDTFILNLGRRAGMRDKEGPNGAQQGPGTPGALDPRGAITLALGTALLPGGQRAPGAWVMNGDHSPHVGVMGATGAGKTRAGNMLIRQVREQAGCPVILFDMGKGDLAANAELVASLGAKVLTCPDVPIPLDILRLETQEDASIQDVAVRFRESFEKVGTSKMGGAQQDAVREATKQALRENHPCQLEHIRDTLVDVYAELKRKPDTVMATFNELLGWKLFAPELSPEQFFTQSWVVDLHKATATAQRLVVFLMLDSLYRWQRVLPDAPMHAQTGHRALRLLVGIDEARKVLGYKHDALPGLVRESRSKGLAIFLLSQSPDDYRKEADNFLENLGLILCFKTNAESNSLHAAFGQQVDLGALGPGVCVTRLPGQPGITRVQVWGGEK